MRELSRTSAIAEEKCSQTVLRSLAAMALRLIQTMFIVCVASGLVGAQSDGRYRPGGNDGRYRPSNDGKYVHDDQKYIHTKDQFGGFGASGRSDGVVNIGGSRLKPKPPATATSTAKAFTTKSPLPPPPSPSIFVIDSNRNTAITKNRFDQGDDLSQTKAGIKIIRQEQEATDNGYHFLYETENGILAEESAQIERDEKGDDVLRAVGFYLYTGDDGKEYRVDYTADAENGFVAKGDHLPTTPPTPPEILELLSILATKPPDTDGGKN